MAELTSSERLQPSLLDRLTDAEPAKKVEPRDKGVLSLNEIRQAVMRDLGWLFSTPNLASVLELEAYPEVSSSVVNYGIPDLAGLTGASVNARMLERLLRKAIVDFEPRILARTLKVKVDVDADSMRRNALTLFIEGQLWSKPVPISLYLKTEIDLESADVAVNETTR